MSFPVMNAQTNKIMKQVPKQFETHTGLQNPREKAKVSSLLQKRADQKIVERRANISA